LFEQALSYTCLGNNSMACAPSFYFMLLLLLLHHAGAGAAASCCMLRLRLLLLLLLLLQNSRWCCGDDANREHIDITRNVFAALANLNVGIIGIQWRVVDCASVTATGAMYNPSQTSGGGADTTTPGAPSGGSV
jgi:hypothetical protein